MNKKRTGLLVIACLFVVSGIWFTTTNAYTLLKGYWLYKMDKPAAAKVEKPKKAEASASPSKTEVQDLLYKVRPKVGDEMGTLYIPKLKSTLPIFHGTDEDELAKGVGHFAGSVLPGENDNTVLSGHRDTVFRRLGEVGKGDLLVVKTSAGEFTYRVRNTKIVDKSDRKVIVPKPRPTLTVTTCYPFRYIGDAPNRYILIANLISSKKAV
ncbi:class D sortase [Peribacillus sp. SCS-37]|uniref:class D sortase n=1 Tax=Paraperibacillus esterisolvens TaxID=3115296 RepID=UPI003905D5DC